jgi:biopolymer transport protein ExbB
MMLPLAVCSLVSLTIVIEESFLFLKMGRSHRAEDVLSLVRDQQHQDALSMVDEAPSPVTRVLRTGIMNECVAALRGHSLDRHRGVGRPVPGTNGPRYDHNARGLLGPIVGMIDSFKIMSLSGLGQPQAVTGGVAEALVCTAASISTAVMTR